jgi:hypothetical protein
MRLFARLSRAFLVSGGVLLAIGSSAVGRSVGPDLVVAELDSVTRFGRVGDITAYSVGTNVCNLGDGRVSWISHTNQHPVIIQSMYRLKDDRFEQIGLSWMAHGFYAVPESLCAACIDSTDGSELGVDCSTRRSAALNGVQENMSMRSDLDAHSGYFPYPWTAPPPEPTIGKRIQIRDADLDPDLNSGASYFVQGHYIAADDATAANNNDNASYRPVIITEVADYTWDVAVTGITQRSAAAVRAWQDADSSVVETDVSVPGEGLFILATKASEIAPGLWRYFYALQNVNSDRSGQSFSIPLPDGAAVTNVGFHDVDYHSGELYDLADWPATVVGGAITWATGTYDLDPYANALRFDSLYSFYFDVDVGPGPTTATIDLFKPGTPDDVTVSTIGPFIDMLDCNGNAIADECDISCGAPACGPPCGASADCNTNGVPDECEPDCNANGVADECDIADCLPGYLWCADCNGNAAPDGCEPDCDGDGIPDDCDTWDDTDGDGIYDCFDLCSCTPIPCECPELDRCCWGPDFCIPDYPRADCIATGGTPDCMALPCEDGCLLPVPDCNNNGIADARDISCGPGGTCDPLCGGSLDINDNGVPEECETDSDSDGINDAYDNCPDDWNPLQEDGDGDNVGDLCDGCPSDPNKIDPGVCGCGNADIDTDSDALFDCEDSDDDNDGVPDLDDADPFDPDVCEDVDGDGCDDCAIGTDGLGPLPDNDPANDGPDADGDGICDAGEEAISALSEWGLVVMALLLLIGGKALLGVGRAGASGN